MFDDDYEWEEALDEGAAERLSRLIREFIAKHVEPYLRSPGEWGYEALDKAFHEIAPDYLRIMEEMGAGCPDSDALDRAQAVDLANLDISVDAWKYGEWAGLLESLLRVCREQGQRMNEQSAAVGQKITELKALQPVHPGSSVVYEGWNFYERMMLYKARLEFVSYCIVHGGDLLPDDGVLLRMVEAACQLPTVFALYEGVVQRILQLDTQDTTPTPAAVFNPGPPQEFDLATRLYYTLPRSEAETILRLHAACSEEDAEVLARLAAKPVMAYGNVSESARQAKKDGGRGVLLVAEEKLHALDLNEALKEIIADGLAFCKAIMFDGDWERGAPLYTKLADVDDNWECRRAGTIVLFINLALDTLHQQRNRGVADLPGSVLQLIVDF